MTDDYVSRVAEPAEAQLPDSGEFALSDDLMLEAEGAGSAPLFSAPVLDRIRTSD